MSDREPSKPYAKKSLGQNFLVDEKAIQKILQAVPENTKLLLEIGPGRGALSTGLFRRTEVFCLLEKDDLFAKSIGATLFVHGSRNHHIFHDDALSFDWEKIWRIPGLPPETDLCVAANLPYNVGTEILFRLLDRYERIPLMVLMFQKEVALRIAAKCDTKSYGTISIAAQNFYETEVLQILKPGAFRPSPKVDSAVILFRRLPEPQIDLNPAEWEKFMALVHAAFAHRRKTLENSLALESRMLPWKIALSKEKWLGLLEETGIGLMRRAETLSVKEFATLFRKLEDLPANMGSSHE